MHVPGPQLPHFPSLGSVRLTTLCIFFALGSYVWGYLVGIVGTVYVSPGFITALKKPKAPQVGMMTAFYYLGTWTSFVFIAPRLADLLGRRYAAFIGALVACVGAALQTGAKGGRETGVSMFIFGRVVSGLGTAVLSTSVPLYQSEITPARRRGRYVVLNHIGFVAGLASAFWVSYGMTFWKGHEGVRLSWRLSIAVVFIPAAVLCLGIPFTPETPRWLLEKGHEKRAEQSLLWIRGQASPTPEVTAELDEIRANILYHHTHSITSWKTLFRDRDLFARLWRAALLQFLSQMSGSTAMKYYLPTNFLALGLGRRMALLAGGIESTLKIACAVIGMTIIDRIGRRAALFVGAAVMVVALLINGALPQAFPGNKNHASDYACIVFIFVFTFGYSIGFGPTTWVYGSEIFPTYVRARGLSISASGGSIGSIIVAQIWPVAFQHIGSRTYFIFMSINLASIVIIYFLFPETKGKTLEEMDGLFGKVTVGSDESVNVKGNTSTTGESGQESPKGEKDGVLISVGEKV
ncbi:hypothetical protein GP486_005893 [Trichoglossum hirsutum]|uniref:Major facilitator superfamily (MFS) profile domain-containing protein n=1 Tax=Trichoglossum hirsutum TaxID=265104 RepID=A0A9P8L8C2_9PEZI|nr:hypothetical protein GP486_005893 [Trichoglossum hirsutum]